MLKPTNRVVEAPKPLTKVEMSPIPGSNLLLIARAILSKSLYGVEPSPIRLVSVTSRRERVQLASLKET